SDSPRIGEGQHSVSGVVTVACNPAGGIDHGVQAPESIVGISDLPTYFICNGFYARCRIIDGEFSFTE
ncbi:MAG TPA: hypothetical protein VF905_14220, partial [Nitrospirota bacterium]